MPRTLIISIAIIESLPGTIDGMYFKLKRKTIIYLLTDLGKKTT